MRFEELSKKHQKFLMYCLSDYIKGKVKKESMDGIIFPSYEELSTSKSPSRYKIDLNLIDDASKLLRIVMES